MAPQTSKPASPTPRLVNPRMFADGIAWLRVYYQQIQYAREAFDGPFFGINMWRIERKRLIGSICHVLGLSKVGLREGLGHIHKIAYFEEPDGDTFSVIIIYKWKKLEPENQARSPITSLIGHFYLMRMVKAFNWTFVEQLEDDPLYYVSLMEHDFRASKKNADPVT